MVPTSNYSTNISFEYTGSLQTWVVPTGVTQLYVDVRAAQGGGTNGGLGGKVQATIPVTEGATLYLVVGGKPSSDVPVYGGGGAGGTPGVSSGNGSAGGGFSGIFSSSVLSQGNSIVVAGAGGGQTLYQAGGIGGQPNGATGGQGNYQSTYQEGGRGGTQSAGGAAGVSIDPATTPASAGSALSGGRGGSVNNSGWQGGGGGGAGYFGGGGGAGGGTSQGAGGGGSSYAIPAATGIVYSGGVQSGNGSIVISY